MFRFDRLSGLLARVAMCIGVCVALAGAASFGAPSHAADATVAPGGATALAPGVASAAPAGAADRTGAVPVVTARALIGLVLLGVLLWLIERTSGARTGRSSDLAPAAGAARADAGPGASGRLVQEVRAWADADLKASPAPAAGSAVGTAPDEPSAQAPGDASAQATHEASVQPGREPSPPDAPATMAEPAAASGAGDMPPPTALPTAAEPAPAATPRPAVFVSQPPLGLAATTATASDATASGATASGATAPGSTASGSTASGATVSDSTVSDAPASRPAAPAAAAAESATVPATEPGRPDDLTKVEGIGPKIAGLLKDAGIGSFAALANAPVPTLRQVLGDAGQRFAMHDPSTWPEQASLAARGDWDALASLQAALHGGRRAPGAPD